MSTAPGTMLLKCRPQCRRDGIVSIVSGRRSATSGPFVGSNVVIPPDSPRFVFVPKPAQEVPFVKVQRKGVLPMPRKPLARTRKQLPWHLENTAPEPVLSEEAKSIPSHHKDHVDWKSKERDLRRKNFLEGYTALRTREAGRSGRGNKEAAAAKAARIKPQVAPEPSYEEMSRPSVLSYMTKSDTWRYSKRSAEEMEARKARHEEIQQAKEYERRTNFHTLYMNAKSFIVNDQQLEDRLSKVYDSEFYQYNKDKHFGIWDEEGWPEDTNYLVHRANNNTGGSAIAQDTGYTEAARKRIMKVTEEMTGGKLVNEGNNSGLR